MSDHSPSAITLTFLPSGRQARVLSGTTILDAAQDLGLEIASLCGGAGLCGKCRIILRQGALPITLADADNLTAEELDRGMRLACMAVPSAGCTVEIPAAAESGGEILATGTARAVAVMPSVLGIAVQLDPPNLEQGASDLEILLAALPEGAQPPSLALLRRLPGLLRRNNWHGRAILFNDRLIDFQPSPEPLCGVAVDLGTTTVVARLIDLESGRILATAAQLNRQRRHGEDVISRIFHANENGIEILHTLIVDQLNEMVDELVMRAGVPRASIYEMVIAGNTVMQHLLLGLPPRHLAEMPYVPVARHLPPLRAGDIGLNLHSEAQIVLLPGLGKFVGGDTSAVLLTLADRLDETWLAVDIGTNGEILLCHEGRIRTTSAAAGPAFEGAQIAAGMRAAAGAIERVFWRDGELEIHVIGGGEATGICGSGLIDAVAALLESGALDETGRLREAHALVTGDPPAGLPPGQPAARLTDKVLLAQKDIRETQLAKGAIATAIALLLRAAGLQPSDLEHIYLAGAFGQYIRPEAALEIGLLPRVDPARIKFVGNAACAGAEMVLINRDEQRLIAELSEKVEYIEVAADKDFQEIFAENLMFAGE